MISSLLKNIIKYLLLLLFSYILTLYNLPLYIDIILILLWTLNTILSTIPEKLEKFKSVPEKRFSLINELNIMQNYTFSQKNL